MGYFHLHTPSSSFLLSSRSWGIPWHWALQKNQVGVFREAWLP